MRFELPVYRVPAGALIAVPPSVAVSTKTNCGESITFTATVTSASSTTPTGTVIFYDGSTELGAETLSDGVASYTTSGLAIGTHTIKAAYSGDASHESASATLTQVVDALLTSTNALTCSPNPAAYGATVTCTATVSGSSSTPTGTVTFNDGSTALGTATLSSGAASYSTASLAVGTHTITAVYAGAAPYSASTSNAVTEVITSSFSLAISPSSRTAYTGQSAAYTVTVTPDTGFTLDVALTCSGVPANTTCVLTPAAVSGGSGNSKLVVQTTAPSQTSASLTDTSATRLALLFAGGLLVFLPRRRWRGRWLILLLSSALALAALPGCGGSFGTLGGGTTPGTYTITVTGTAVDGSVTITKTATTSITVKSLF